MDNQRQDDELKILAGFFAGEGCIMLNKSSRKSKSPTVVVCVGNTEKEWCDLFYHRFGGRVWTTLPKVRHSLPYHKWEVKDEKAGAFLQEILPFLIGEKRPQAKLALAVAAIKATKPFRGRAGFLGHFSPEQLVAMNGFEEQLRELRRAVAETKRANALPMRSDSPILPVMAVN